MLPVSNDTLLRVVRRRAMPRSEKLAVIGINDWAYRRNHRYGTIICDLERRRVVALLPDRGQATAEAWLRQHPGREAAVQIASKNFVYSGLYRIVLTDWECLSVLYRGHGLVPIRTAVDMTEHDLALAARVDEAATGVQ